MNTKRHGHTPRSALLIYTLVAMASVALGADTTEPFDLGATNFEMYLNYEGLGLDTDLQNIAGETVWGYGITERFSGYAGFVASADGDFVGGDKELAFGLYGTPLDGDHLDLDLFLGFSALGPQLDQFILSPSLELNWDSRPDLAGWGLYTRAGYAISGRTTTEGSERFSDFELTLGCYWTVSPGHQLLVEFDGAFANDGVDNIHLHDLDREWSTGGIALGYNVEINGTMEMINQVSYDLPDDDEDASFGLMTGFIATLP